MADIDIIFRGAIDSNTEANQLEVYANARGNIHISIKEPNNKYATTINLSKSTAIRFHRELKKQISFIESEVNDG